MQSPPPSACVENSVLAEFIWERLCPRTPGPGGAGPSLARLLGLQIAMPHQWLEGNLPVSAKCTVCDKTCGSVLRLQDWRCLWCKVTVSVAHGGSGKCPGGRSSAAHSSRRRGVCEGL